MISAKEYVTFFSQTPLTNLFFSLTGGFILLDTDYIEKLVRFGNDSVFCTLTSILFEKNNSNNLTISPLCAELSIQDMADLIFILAKKYSKDIKKCDIYQDINLWCNAKQCVPSSTMTKLYDLLKKIATTFNTRNQRDILIFYIVQAAIYQKINTHAEYLAYYHYVTNRIFLDKYHFDASLQRILLTSILEKHYPKSIPQLCYTRLAYINDQQVFFPDCCITTIRNVINMLLYNGNEQAFDLSLLKNVKLNVYQNIIDFYYENPSVEKIQLQSVHNQWANATQGLNHYNSRIQYNTPSSNPYCELKAGASNMMHVFGVLFSTSNINEIIYEFNQVRDTPIQIDSSNLNLASMCIPDYENKIVLYSEDETLEWYFLEQHFRCAVFRQKHYYLDICNNLQESDAFNWLHTLISNQELGASSINSLEQYYHDGNIFNFLTICLRTPEHLFSAVNILLDKIDLSQSNENTIKTLINLFNAIPNDPFHLYNKYILIEKAQSVRPHIANSLNININEFLQ